MAPSTKPPASDANVETWAKYAAEHGIIVSSHVSVPDIIATLRSEGVEVGLVQDRDIDGDRSQDGKPQPDGDETVDADNPADAPRKRKEVERTEAGGAAFL